MTNTEMVELAIALARGEVAPDFVDWDQITEKERRMVSALVLWEIERRGDQERRRKRGKSQRRARAFLRSLLTPDQIAWMGRNNYFFAEGSHGGMYRLWPGCGSIERVSYHGKRWFAVERYCLHDPEEELPPADVTIAHLLMITSDETVLPRKANVTVSDQLWNGDYLRRINAARRQRAG